MSCRNTMKKHSFFCFYPTIVSSSSWQFDINWCGWGWKEIVHCKLYITNVKIKCRYIWKNLWVSLWLVQVTTCRTKHAHYLATISLNIVPHVNQSIFCSEKTHCWIIVFAVIIILWCHNIKYHYHIVYHMHLYVNCKYNHVICCNKMAVVYLD